MLRILKITAAIVIGLIGLLAFLNNLFNINSFDQEIQNIYPNQRNDDIEADYRTHLGQPVQTEVAAGEEPFHRGFGHAEPARHFGVGDVVALQLGLECGDQNF